MGHTAIASEFEIADGVARHLPTGIRISLAYQNVKGEWALNVFKGDRNRYGPYHVSQVVQLGGRLLLG